MLKKSLRPLNILDKVFTLKNSNKLDSIRLIRLLDKVFTLKNSNEFDSIRLIRLLVKNLPRYSHADRPCIFTVLMML